MKHCPQCGLLLEPLDWDDVQPMVCRGCGGVWFPTQEVFHQIAAHLDRLQALLEPYPGASVAEVFQGLPLRCPLCRTTYLELRTDNNGYQCPTCGGVWMDASHRAQLLKAIPADQPSVSRSPTPAALPREPARSTVVLTCMDARIPALEMLGFSLGDAHVLRNAGAILTDDALRSVLISHYLMGTNRLVIVGHTDCGMTRFNDDNLLARIKQETGVEQASPAAFLAFKNVEQSVRRQVARARRHPWLAGRVVVEGMIYELETGRLRALTQ